jgi:hypothetical protein
MVLRVMLKPHSAVGPSLAAAPKIHQHIGRAQALLPSGIDHNADPGNRITFNIKLSATYRFRNSSVSPIKEKQSTTYSANTLNLVPHAPICRL